MKKHGIMAWRLMLGVAVVSGTAAWGAVTPQEEDPVEVRFAGFGVKREEFDGDGPLRDSPLQLKFHVFWSVNFPWRFDGLFGRRIQYLDVTGSDGKKLAPAGFDLKLCGITQLGVRGMEVAHITGTSAELPRPEVSWLRLKGVFRVPLARLEKSPVYEIPAEKGAEVNILLPGAGGEDEGDIAVAQDSPVGRISLKKYVTSESKGKTMVELEIELETDSSFELDHIELLDDRDEAAGIWVMDNSPHGDGLSRAWTKDIRFESAEQMEKLRVRMVYKVSRGEVAVPVDVRLGMFGEVPEDPAVRQGRRKRSG